MAKDIKRLELNKPGSALIMTVVLTVMLAIVAVMFVAVARMDMASTGNIADNKALESSVKSIIELINRQLVLDTPGVAGQEYYDYPDANNAWLASIEPYFYSDHGTPADRDDDVYNWRQISDVTNYLHQHSYSTTDVNTDPPGSKVIKDYPTITLNSGQLAENWADADGDGIADSKWFELPNMRSSKGKPIYAAVRVIDNSGMVNINTAHEFNANDPNISEIDGSGQMQINLNGLLKGTDSINTLHTARCGTEPSNNRAAYTQNVIWQYGEPNGNYLPFDISDELELRYRYCIDSRFISRFEVTDPCTNKGAGWDDFGNLYDTSTSGTGPCASRWGLEDWQRRITEFDDCKTDRRHLLTSLNLDRIIDPCGVKMTNINTADVNDIYAAIRRGILDANGNFPNVDKVAAQIAVNIIDYRDTDSDVNYFDLGTERYYGLERPCVYISELVYRKDPCNSYKSYAVELYKPYAEDDDASNWKLIIKNPSDINVTVVYLPPNKQYHFIRWQNSNIPLTFDPASSNQTIVDNAFFTAVIFDANSTVLLTRDVNGTDIIVDSVPVPAGLVTDGNHSFQRDITPAKCIRRLWDPSINGSGPPTLGRVNDYNTNADANFIQAHPANSDFNNIGQIGMILRKAAYYKVGDSNNDVIGYNNNLREEYQVRLNLADPNFQKIFRYLTVIDPNNFYPNDPNYAHETRVRGRININTAPAYVLAQLPWVSLRKNPAGYNDANLAKAIVAYRDKAEVRKGDANYPNYCGSDPCGFRNIGQLCNVVSGNSDFGIDYYKRDGLEQVGFPDLDPNDGAVDDFKERDLIFARISNLVTVRSDVFTAYILVRVCTNVKADGTVEGPQKRVITILDRSGVYREPNGVLHDEVKIRAFQLTPEAR